MVFWPTKKQDVKPDSQKMSSETVHEALKKKWFKASEMWAREEIRLENAKTAAKARQELWSYARQKRETIQQKINVTESELMDEIDGFFRFCDERLRPYTTSWLALRLGTTRKVLKEFLVIDGKFKNAINYGWARCEAFVEDWLFDWSITTVWSIFSLKDWNGWNDRPQALEKLWNKTVTELTNEELLNQIDDKWFLEVIDWN